MSFTLYKLAYGGSNHKQDNNKGKKVITLKNNIEKIV